ncbi:unnamed protein product, partial [Notodromas monacha]
IHVTNLSLSRVDSVFLRGAAKRAGAQSQLEFIGPPVGRQVESYCTKPKAMPDTSSLKSGNGTLFVVIVAGASSVVLLIAVMSAVMLCRRCAESMSSRDKWSAPCAVGLDSSAASSCGVGEGTAFAGGRLRYMPINYSSESGWWAGACQYSSITTPAPDMSRQQQQQQHHHHQGRHQEQQIGGGKSGTHRPVLAEHVADHAATLVAPDGSATPGLKQEFKACCRGLAKATSSKKNKGYKDK